MSKINWDRLGRAELTRIEAWVRQKSNRDPYVNSHVIIIQNFLAGKSVQECSQLGDNQKITIEQTVLDSIYVLATKYGMKFTKGRILSEQTLREVLQQCYITNPPLPLR